MLTDLQKLTFISCIRTLDAVWRTYKERLQIGRDGARGSTESMLLEWWWWWWWSNPLCRSKNLLSGVQLAWIQSFPSPNLVTKSVCPTIYPLLGRQETEDGFMPFPKALVRSGMQTTLSRFWTRINDTISSDQKSYIQKTFYRCVRVCIYVCVCAFSYLCMCVFMCWVCVFVYVRVCLLTYMYVYVSVFVYIYIYIYIL